MKGKFLRFLRDHKALQEFTQELAAVYLTVNEIDAQFLDGGAKYILSNGCMFFWADAVTDIDWAKLDREWVEIEKQFVKDFNEKLASNIQHDLF